MQNQVGKRVAVSRPSRVFSPRWKLAATPYVFISPFFILFFVFGLFPLLFSLFLAFHLWSPIDGLGNWKYVGWDNFALALAPVDTFWVTLKNTIYIGLLSGIPQHILAIPTAYIIHSVFRKWQSSLTTLLFLPYITNVIAIAVVFGLLYSERQGLLNYALTSLGLDPVRWLGEPSVVPFSIAALVIWRYFGWNVVLYLSGLQAISEDVYEAATVDGATGVQKFFYITLPLLRPMMFYAITLTIIGNMQIFDEPFILTGENGGVAGSGYTIAMHIYNTAFRDQDMGYASAMSWLLFLAIFVLSMINNYLFSRGGNRI